YFREGDPIWLDHIFAIPMIAASKMASLLSFPLRDHSALSEEKAEHWQMYVLLCEMDSRIGVGNLLRCIDLTHADSAQAAFDAFAASRVLVDRADPDFRNFYRQLSKSHKELLVHALSKHVNEESNRGEYA